MHLRPVLGLMLFASTFAPAAAEAGSVSVLLRSDIYDVQTQNCAHCDFSVGDAATGPISGSLRVGILVDMATDAGFNDYEWSLTAFATARADYGLNGARAGSDYRGGSDPNDPYYHLYSPTFEPTPLTNLIAESVWRDGFVITGGTGFDTMSVTMDLAGRFDNPSCTPCTYLGDVSAYLDQSAGTVSYTLGYQDFVHAGGETGFKQSVISWSRDVAGIAATASYQETLVGTFSFEYGVPFELTSGISVFSAGVVTSDFLDTATLTHFTLPPGATLVADSGSYAVVVPEPASAWLLGLTLAGLGILRRRLSST